jgi:type II secretory pathway component PulK
MKSEMRNQKSKIQPRGVALMAVVVTLVILALMMSAVAWQMVASGRVLLHRHYELQAGWLARSGIEHAAARLLEQPSEYRGETLHPIELSTVNIDVTYLADSHTYRVRSEARYPIDLAAFVMRTQTRIFKRVVDGKTVRLDCIASDEDE